MRSQKLNPAAFLGVKILTPMEQDRVRGGTMRTVQQQQQQQRQLARTSRRRLKLLKLLKP